MNDEESRGVVWQFLEALNVALRSKDLDLALSFDEDALFLGSEPGELARGRREIHALLSSVFGSSSNLQFAWYSIEVNHAHAVLWFLASGEAVISTDKMETRRAYNLTGVLTSEPEGWRWRLFHGSEPWIDRPVS